MSRLYRRLIAPPPDGDCKMGFSLSGIRRAPHCIRQSLKLSTVTVDEEFEALLEECNDKEAHLREFQEQISFYQTTFDDVLRNSVNVGISMKCILDPFFGGCSESDTTSCEPFNNCKRYLSILDDAKLSCDDTFSAIPKVLHRKMHQLLGCFDSIRKYIRKRDLALLDYDKILDKFDPMSIKRATGILSARQAQQYHSLERQVDHLKGNYDSLNAMLKLELPYFFKLVDAFMEMVLQYVFYMQLSGTYQVLQSVFTLESPMNFTKEEVITPDFISQHVAKFKRVKDPELNIISFHKMHLELLLEARKQSTESCNLSNYEPYSDYCIALFDYTAQTADDLEFTEGAMIKILNHEGKWWQGELNGNTGLFPSNFVKVMETQ